MRFLAWRMRWSPPRWFEGQQLLCLVTQGVMLAFPLALHLPAAVMQGGMPACLQAVPMQGARLPFHRLLGLLPVSLLAVALTVRTPYPLLEPLQLG